MRENFYQKIWNKMEKFQYVSFDIFDTLIKRNVSTPREVFKLVEEKYNLLNPTKPRMAFYKQRIEAERKAVYLSDWEEVTFDAIYDQMEMSEVERKTLQELEIETELQVCIPNYPIQEIYKRCVVGGKTIVITSDMYLPQWAICKILTNCGYAHYHRLYLSSTVGLKKITGNLFKYVLSDMQIDKSELVHIGDSKRADIFACMKKGIKSIYLSHTVINTTFINRTMLGNASEHSPYIFINNMLSKYHSRSKLFLWGYEALGPLLLGFCHWIHSKVHEQNIERTFFLARDMYLVVQVYQRLYPDESVQYLEISRKSLRRAYILESNQIHSVFDTMGRREYSIGAVCDAIGLETGGVVEGCAALGVNIAASDEFTNKNTIVYDALNYVILEMLRKEGDLSLDYLKSMGMSANIKMAIVDVGWHGTLQNMLEKILRTKVMGMYFGNTKRASFSKMDTCGYWFDTDDERLVLSQLSMMYILEVMLFPKIGTTSGYVYEENHIIPLYAKCEMGDGFEKVEEFQIGAMQFIDDYINKSPYKNLPFLKNDAVMAYEKLAFQPTLYQAKMLSSLPYEDGDIKPLALEKNIFYYLLRPRSLLNDYKQARWKPGFIKQVFPFIKNPHQLDLLVKNRKN
ncbi:hypothetical protein B5F39_08695 [Cloacibacillus sp. An23]|nr:hypothetical protein B5F39_08695 [Cloacibacillus sp. An23]